ncbi:MAG TPA: response regulator transcription factor [Leptospiraceae bacterium]|nr:response regulator transcription factor [Leptospiraceae bacterium]HMW07064.1 response regulator transcription factor [Leptospiraceae bacterium]HMX35574.1 response regulator transcription factor [Leptospiraceae bacterium]HMY33737.1 response regulator transcription factor [Leptospiraceae bacterium]HMZ66229.1 response regulator transcription factor [Leptospiraceae bacterium]
MDFINNKKFVFGIIEDDLNFQSLLTGLLKTRKEVDRIHIFNSAEDALVSSSLPYLDILIVDYRLGGMDGIRFLANPAIRNLEIPKLILTGFNAEEKIFEALKYGATGYMLKEEIYSLDSILEILLTGGAYISPMIALKVANYFKEMEESIDDLNALTSREKEIIHELANGFSPKEISESLDISVLTVRTHIRNIYKKLEVSNQVQLLKKAKELHFLKE